MSADDKMWIKFHNILFRLSLDEPESLETLVRLTAPAKVLARKAPNAPPRLVDVTLHDSLGREFRADAIIELSLTSLVEPDRIFDSYLLYEHKSYDDRGDVLQGNINRLVFQLQQLRKDPGSGKVPLVFVIVFMHGPGVTDRPACVRDMVDVPPELADLADPGGCVIRFDATQITLKVLPKDPTKGAALLVLARSHKQRLTDEEAVYVIRGLIRSLDKDYFDSYVANWIDLAADRVSALLKEQLSEEEAEMRMGSFAAGFEKRSAISILLDQLQEKFQRVPEEREQQIRDASLEQLKAWCRRLVKAPDIDAVFEG